MYLNQAKRPLSQELARSSIATAIAAFGDVSGRFCLRNMTARAMKRLARKAPVGSCQLRRVQ